MTHTRFRGITLFIMTFILALAPFSQVRASYIVSNDSQRLDVLWESANQVLFVTCLETYPTRIDAEGHESDRGRPATAYVFQVHSSYKGDAQEDEIFQMYRFGWDQPVEGERYYVPALGPSFKVGEAYIAFFEHNASGLSNVAGGGFGVFNVFEKNGALHARNAANNRNLLGSDIAQKMSSRISEEAVTAIVNGEGAIDLNSFDSILTSLR